MTSRIIYAVCVSCKTSTPFRLLQADLRPEELLRLQLPFQSASRTTVSRYITNGIFADSSSAVPGQALRQQVGPERRCVVAQVDAVVG